LGISKLNSLEDENISRITLDLKLRNAKIFSFYKKKKRIYFPI